MLPFKKKLFSLLIFKGKLFFFIFYFLNDKGAFLIGAFASLKELFPFSIFKACLP
jgi:hypothetical protein